MLRRSRTPLAAVVLAMLCLWLALSPQKNPMLDAAKRYQHQIALASGATYISLRSINAAMSFAQEVQVGGSFFVEGNVQPLKWLEPVDDTVERISAAIFAMAALSALLSLSLAPVASVGFVLLAVALLTRGGCDAATGWGRAPPVLRRLSGVCGGLGFAFAIGLPLAFVLGVWAGDLLTHQAAAEANATIDQISGEAQRLIGLDQGKVPDDRSWRETFNAYLGAAGTFWDQADDLLQASLTLMGIFLLRMVVLPLVLLVSLWAIARRLLAF